MLHRFLFLFFSVCLWNARYLFLWIGGEGRWRMKFCGDPFLATEKKQFIRKVSLWFNKSPQQKMLFAFVLAFIASPFLSFVLRPSLSDEEGEEDINPLFKIIQLFPFHPQLLHLCAMKAPCSEKSTAFGNEIRALFFWRIRKGKVSGKNRMEALRDNSSMNPAPFRFTLVEDSHAISAQKNCATCLKPIKNLESHKLDSE